MRIETHVSYLSLIVAIFQTTKSLLQDLMDREKEQDLLKTWHSIFQDFSPDDSRKKFWSEVVKLAEEVRRQILLRCSALINA
jgi:hypothetical protein